MMAHPMRIEAIGEMDAQLFSIESQQAALAERKSQLVAAYKETSELRHILQAVASNWDRSIEVASSVNQERLQNLKYFQRKTQEYSVTLQGLKDTLSKNGAHSSIYHSTLKQLADHLQALEAQNNEKQAQLEGFQFIPPDITLAKAKIEEAAIQLLQLEEQIAGRVKALQLHEDV